MFCQAEGNTAAFCCFAIQMFCHAEGCNAALSCLAIHMLRLVEGNNAALCCFALHMLRLVEGNIELHFAALPHTCCTLLGATVSCTPPF